MAHRTESPDSPGAPTPPGAGPRAGRFPGLHESLPLLMFGAAAVIAGAYLVLTRAPGIGGHVPLWAYLATLGSIAIAGGLAGSVVGDPLEELPRAGDAIGEDLLVVPRSEWLELRSRADASRTSAPAPRAVAPSPSPSPVRTPVPERPTPAPASRPVAPVVGAVPTTPSSVPDWWESALATRTPSEEGHPVFPTGRDAPKKDDEVLTSLDAIATEAAPTALTPEPAAPTVVRPPPGALLPPPRPRTPRAKPAVSPSEIDLQIDEIARGVGHLLPPPGAAASSPAAPVASPVACVRCQNPLNSGAAELECESCGRPLCGNCQDLAKREGNPGLCPVCAMLLDSAGGA